jgi:pyruvate formate lyase activating enzyme
MVLKGLLFDIQGFSVHDGPGCRTLIFFKGCPLKCRWCSNPEGIEPYQQIMYQKLSCVGDHACEVACKKKAISTVSTASPIKMNRSVCSSCKLFECTDACNYNALRFSGYYMTVDEVMETVQRDRQYWGQGGGVTLSGGEPMLQYKFAAALLERCFGSYIHTAMETSGYAPWEHYKSVLGHLEWIFLDLKHMDTKKHQWGTGVPNKLILENARKLSSVKDLRIIFRLPLVPGFNDTVTNIKSMAKFVKGLGKDEVNVLPLHHLGSSKYDQLGRDYHFKDMRKPTLEGLKNIKDIFSDLGIKCYISHDTPF